MRSNTRSGLEQIQAMRARPEPASIPILLITASAQRTELAEGLTYGVAGYVTKPFRMADLCRTVADVLARGPSAILTPLTTCGTLHSEGERDGRRDERIAAA